MADPAPPVMANPAFIATEESVYFNDTDNGETSFSASFESGFGYTKDPVMLLSRIAEPLEPGSKDLQMYVAQCREVNLERTSHRTDILRDCSLGLILTGKYIDALRCLKKITKETKEQSIDTLFLMAECEFYSTHEHVYFEALQKRFMDSHVDYQDDLLLWGANIQKSSYERTAWALLYKIANDREKNINNDYYLNQWFLNFSRDFATKCHETMLAFSSIKFKSFLDDVLYEMMDWLEGCRDQHAKSIALYQCRCCFYLCDSIGREKNAIAKFETLWNQFLSQHPRPYAMKINIFIKTCLAYLHLICARSVLSRVYHVLLARGYSREALWTCVEVEDFFVEDDEKEKCKNVIRSLIAETESLFAMPGAVSLVYNLAMKKAEWK